MAYNLDKPSILKLRLQNSQLGSALRIMELLNTSSFSASAECSEVRAGVYVSSRLSSG